MRRIALAFLFVFALVAGATANPVTALAAPAAPTIVTPIPGGYANQTVPFKGQAVTLQGNIGTSVARPVTLQKYSSSWSTYATGTTDETGAYEFTVSTTSSSRKFRVYAAAYNGQPSVTSEVLTLVTQTDKVTISALRLGQLLRVTGTASPAIEGRSFTLESASSSSGTWTTVATVAEKADGTLQSDITAPTGTRYYRWVGAAVTSSTDPTVTLSSGVKSSAYKFAPSPKELGKNVIYVTTDNGGTPTTKGKVYTAKAILVSGSEATTTLSAEISVRGNSSATKPKKPYKLKFTEKQKPFGMKSDKTWVLLANYQDWTLIRSRIAFELGRKETGLKWTPDERFAELYINGKYLGSYQMIQSIKIDNNRVNVSKDNGQIIEHDPHWADSGSTETGFIGVSKMNYSFKDPDEMVEQNAAPSDLTPDRVLKMKNKILQFESILYSKDWSKISKDADGNILYAGAPLAAKDDWMTYLDLNSSVDYILTREFTKDNDADFYRSNFFYTNNVLPFFTGSSTTYKYDWSGTTSSDKFFMGPIWDFDRSAGAPPLGGTGISNTTGWWTNGNGSPNHDTNKIHWFTRIWKDPRFVSALKARWEDKKADYQSVGYSLNGEPSRVDAAVADLGTVVAANDRTRWAGYGTRYAAKTSSYNAEINWVRNWYAKRYDWMNAQIAALPSF